MVPGAPVTKQTSHRLASFALAIGLLAAGVAYCTWVVNRTALNPATSGEVAKALLSAEPVQQSFSDELAKQVGEDLPNGQQLTPQQVAAIETVLRDPKFIAAFGNSLEDFLTQLLADERAPGQQLTLDTTAVTQAVHDALLTVDPDLAARVTPTRAPVELLLGDAETPNLSGTSHTIRTTTMVATLLALVLVPLGVWFAFDRRRALRRVGVRGCFIAAGPALLFLAAPHLLASSSSTWAATSAPVLAAYGRTITPSLVAVVTASLSLWFAARAWPTDAPASVATTSAGAVRDAPTNDPRLRQAEAELRGPDVAPAVPADPQSALQNRA